MEPSRTSPAGPGAPRSWASEAAPGARSGSGSVDHAEIAKFEAMADAWWDPTGKFKPLHRLNPVRVRFIRDRLAAGLGRTLGTIVASLLRRITPALAVVLVLLGDAAAALLAALFYGMWTLALLGLVAGLGQALAKFSLDATIQRDIPPKVQASAFGRSDTTCQLAWVLGGFVGIALPLDPPRLGLTVAFAALAAWAAYVLSTAPRARRRRRGVAPERAAQADVETQPLPMQRRP